MSPGKLTPDLMKLAGVVMLGALMMQLDGTMTTIALNTLLGEFHAPLTTIQWVTTGYLLAMALVIPLTGWAMERFGARTVWMGSLTAFLAGSVLCGTAWSAGSLIAFRVIQGLGGGMLLPLGIAVLAQAAGPERMGRVQALLGVPSMLGPVLGPVLGGWIVSDFGWRWIFFINVPICLIALVASARVVPATRAPGASRLDVLGLALLSPSCTAIVYGLAEASRAGGFGAASALVPLVCGVILLAAFVAHALRTKGVPLIDLRLFRDRQFAAASGVIFTAGAVLFAALGAMPLYFQQVRGATPLTAGLLLAPQGVGMAISLVAGGLLLDRVGPKPVLLSGLALTAAASFVYTQLTAGTSLVVLSAALVVSGLGVGSVLAPAMTAAMRGLRHDQMPRASTATRIFMQLGGSFGGAVLLIVLQSRIAERGVSQLAEAFGDTFWWVLGFAALAFVPALLLPRSAPSAPAAAAEHQDQHA
ncbi:DHA2 family efflux MFS transporter permease subunit [Streptosporangiaceae bacterium NEAU-GS5]|nr:DHA2 family efflux MFS transporter permease subunit [Streptosporangiaceae bacterium NEAU-GS5]